MTFKADTLTPVAQDPAPVDPVEPEDPKNDSDQTSQDNGTTDTNVPKTGDNMGLGLMMLLVVGGPVAPQSSTRRETSLRID